MTSRNLHNFRRFAVPGILQARILEWVAIPFSRGSSQTRARTRVYCIVDRRFTVPGSIPGLGRSPGEGRGYPPQYSWASLMTQLIKNLPAMWETWA